MALFMQSFDATILNTALPTIATDLQTPVFEMQNGDYRLFSLPLLYLFL